MTPDKHLETRRRILVAMDSSQGSLSALETATILAELVHADLEGLFVEDADLIALTDLPISREVRLAGGSVRALELVALEEELRMQAIAARRAMQRAAARRRLAWRFRSVRGSVLAELAAAAREADVLCIGRRGRSPLRSARLGSTIRAALGSAPIVLVAGTTEAVLLGPVAVVVGPGGISDRAIRFAAELAEKSGQPLQAYLAGDDAETMETQRRRIGELLPEGQSVRFHAMDAVRMPSLIDALRQERQGLLVCGAGRDQAQLNWLERLVCSVDCPVLVFSTELAEPDNSTKQNLR